MFQVMELKRIKVQINFKTPTENGCFFFFFFFTKIMIGFDLNYKIYQFEEKIMRTNHQKTSRVIMMSLAILIELLLQLLVGNIDHYSVG